MEYLLRLDAGRVKDALLVHIDELFLGDLLVEVLVDLPDHELDLFAGELALHHLLQNGLDVVGGEVLVLVRLGQGVEHVEQVFLFGGV
jgi:hypothetical protein